MRKHSDFRNKTRHLGQVVFSLSVSLLLSVGCGKRGESGGKIYLSDHPVENESAQIVQEVPQAQAASESKEAPTPEVVDPLAGYDVSVIHAIEGGIDHFAGILEVPYGRIYRNMLHNAARNVYPGAGNPDEQRFNVNEILQRYSSMGLISYSAIDLNKEYAQRHAGKTFKPLEINHGSEYNVSITWKAHANLVTEMTTPFKVYVRNFTAKVTSIVKDTTYTSPSLSASEDYRLLVGTAEMHPNSGLFERNYIPQMQEIKFRTILHQNPITRRLSPLSVDIGDPASSGWFTNRIPSEQYGSPYDLTTTVPPPKPIGEPEPTFAEAMQAAQDNLPLHHSPSGKFILKKTIVTTRGREACELVSADGQRLWGELMSGPLGEIHWSPDEKAVAFHEGNGDAIEGAWVVRMDPPGLVKGITDEFSTLFNKMAVAEMASTAAGLSPDADDLPETIRTKVIGWEDANTIRIQVSAHYLPSDKILEMDALLDITKEGEDAIHFPSRVAVTAKYAAGSTAKPPDEWRPIIVSGLYDSESIAINLGSGLVSFGMSWMTRIGATQAIGRFEDVDWQRAKIVEEVGGGAFKGTVLIEIPLKPDTGFVIKTWMPSQEHPEQPWAEGIKPDQEKKSGASLGVHAMNRAGAESVVRKLHTMRDASDVATPGADGQEGEMYPATRLEPIREEDFSDLTEDQLRHAINEMFARHGAAFGRPEVAALFQDKPWYKSQPDLTLEQIEKEKFSDVERSNLLKLAELRNRKKSGR